jgi:hypothetical protein
MLMPKQAPRKIKTAPTSPQGIVAHDASDGQIDLPMQAAMIDLDSGTVDSIVRPNVEGAILTGQIRDIQDHMDMGAYQRDFDRIKDKVQFLHTIGDPEELKRKVRALEGCKVMTTAEVEELSRKQKKDTERLIIFLIMVNIIGYIAKEFFNWTVIWDILTRIYIGSLVIADRSLNDWIIRLPYGVPLVFPFSGTFGLIVGTWCISLMWSALRIINEKLGGFAGFYYILNDRMEPIGKFFAAGATLTGTHMVDDTIMCNVSTPSDSINEPRFFSVWKMFRSWFPFYLGNQIRVDKIVIFATRDMFFPMENYAQQHNQVLGELFDTGFFFVSGPTIYKIYTCDKIMAWNRIPPGAYPKITHQAMSAYKGTSIQLKIAKKNLDLLFTEMELLLRNKHVIDKQFVKMMSDRFTHLGLIDRQTNVIRAKYGGYWDNLNERMKISDAYQKLVRSQGEHWEERYGLAPPGQRKMGG